MFDNNKMAQFLKAGAKPVTDNTPAPRVSGLQILSEAFKKIEDKEQEAESNE